MGIPEKIFLLLLCHFIGDYVLQSSYIAATKGENLWHMTAHSFLYTLPFYLCFGFDWRLIGVLVTHFITDILKARWKIIDYPTDQLDHLIEIFFAYFVL